MAANSSTSDTTQRRAASRTTRTGRTDAQKIREGLTKVRNGSVSYARQTAERSVDLPVGAVMTVADRMNEVVEPFTKRQTAHRELESFRIQVERELNKLERRGAQSRRKVRTRARQSRNRFRRELRQRRRGLQTTVKQNRARAHDSLKRAQDAVSERVTTLV
jgi:hypothetical protein